MHASAWCSRCWWGRQRRSSICRCARSTLGGPARPPLRSGAGILSAPADRGQGGGDETVRGWAWQEAAMCIQAWQRHACMPHPAAAAPCHLKRGPAAACHTYPAAGPAPAPRCRAPPPARQPAEPRTVGAPPGCRSCAAAPGGPASRGGQRSTSTGREADRGEAPDAWCHMQRQHGAGTCIPPALTSAMRLVASSWPSCSMHASDSSAARQVSVTPARHRLGTRACSGQQQQLVTLRRGLAGCHRRSVAAAVP